MKFDEFEILSPKKTIYLSNEYIRKKYANNEVIDFTEQCFKSLLALSFASDLHSAYAQKMTKADTNGFFLDSNPYFKISIDFGLTLLDNLSDFNKEWFNKLLSQSYKFEEIMNNPDIIEFVQEGLIDQLNVRQWEYGKYFLESFSKFMDSSIISKPIKSIQNQEEFWVKMYQIMVKIKEPIEKYEPVLLAYFIKNHVEKHDLNMLDYFRLGLISSQKMPLIFKRQQNLKQALREIIALDQNLNKKKGRKR